MKRFCHFTAAFLTLLPFKADSQTPEASTILPMADVSCSPLIVAKDRWSVLVLTQIFSGKESDSLTLSSQSLEQRALFAKQVDLISPVDESGTYQLRVQVYLIKPIGKTLDISKNDFKNTRGILGPRLEFHIKKDE